MGINHILHFEKERETAVQYFVGQLMGILSTVIFIAMPVFRKKWQMLAATLTGNLLMALNFILIGQFGSAAFLCVVAVIQSVVSMNHTVKETKVTRWEQLLFCGLYVVFGLLGIVTAPGFVPEINAANLLELLPIFGSAMLTFSIFARSEQRTRMFLLVNAGTWAVYTAIVGSTTFFAEFFAAVTTAAALWKYRKNK
jgi:hypothetical protein